MVGTWPPRHASRNPISNPIERDKLNEKLPSSPRHLSLAIPEPHSTFTLHPYPFPCGKRPRAAIPPRPL